MQSDAWRVEYDGNPTSTETLEVLMDVALAVMAAVPIGFLAGLWTIKVKQSWCGQCGANLGCLDCVSRGREVASGHPRRT